MMNGRGAEELGGPGGPQLSPHSLPAPRARRRVSAISRVMAISPPTISRDIAMSRARYPASQPRRGGQTAPHKAKLGYPQPNYGLWLGLLWSLRGGLGLLGGGGPLEGVFFGAEKALQAAAPAKQ